MDKLRQAAEQALEALEQGYSSRLWPIQSINAIQALRQALAESANSTTNLVEPKASSQPEQEHLGGEWVPCVKLPVIVHVRNQRNGETHISTREGITPVLPDDLIMRGVAGEEYPIRRELFERTYTFDVDNVYMSEERVQKTEKSIHEPVGYVTNSGTAAYLHRGVYLEDDTPLYTAPPHYWGNVTSAELVEELRRRDMLMVPIKEQDHIRGVTKKVEPVAWMKPSGLVSPYKHGSYQIPLYRCSEVKNS